MTQREELAARLEAHLPIAECPDSVMLPITLSAGTLRRVIAALRQEPSVEEIARVIRETVDIWANGEITGSHKAAEAIRELWRRAGYDGGE